MSDRWVCKRCFADNDGDAAGCHRCGLIRGAESTEADQSTWAATPAAQAAERGGRGGVLRQLLRFWWIPILVVVLAVGYLTTARRDSGGAISDSGTLGVDDLRIGDCFDLGDGEVEFSDVDAGPCNEPHQFELFHVATWDGGSGYPTDEAMVEFVLANCDPAFEAYVGSSPMTSQFGWEPFTPTEPAWTAGDRSIRCVASDPSDPALTASIRNTGR